jgi:putative transposase
MWLGAAEKDFLMSLLHRVAFYCGVEVITFCIMSNHFHLLVRVPEKAAADAALDINQLIMRVKGLYGTEVATELQAGSEALVIGGKQVEWEAEIALHQARMHDLSVFMKLLKQRFTMWHNHRLRTKGTLWTERFKSVLVETRSGASNPLDLVAAYIDLNPVRAGVVAEAEDYAYSGYGSARRGNVESQRGLNLLAQTDSGTADEDAYQQLIEGRSAGATSGSTSQNAASVLRSRQAALVKGAIVGSAAFVMAVVEAMIELRRSVRPQAYATVGLGESLWVGKRFRKE